ncbi:hypothetical protein MPSEU_000891400 [Mayamaea pseudoterrestris]|nr:hypothetical protein MPSEU_000891400 [Mayamaea pseudoterrestris]
MLTNNPDDTKQKMEDYTHFLKDTLKPNLAVALRARNDTQHEMDEFVTLQKDMLLWENNLNCPLLTLEADLGHERVRCEAQVVDAATIFVNVGYGFHVELTCDEATRFAKRRIELLTTKLKLREIEVIRLTDHVTSAQEILEQLARMSS